MKTIAVGRGNTWRLVFALAALGAVYFYRRQGGSVRGLLDQGMTYVRQGRDMINRVAPSVTEGSVTPAAQV